MWHGKKIMVGSTEFLLCGSISFVCQKHLLCQWKHYLYTMVAFWFVKFCFAITETIIVRKMKWKHNKLIDLGYTLEQINSIWTKWFDCAQLDKTNNPISCIPSINQSNIKKIMLPPFRKLLKFLIHLLLRSGGSNNVYISFHNF